MRLIGSFRIRSHDDDYLAELKHHLEMAEERFRQQGYSHAEAARLARVRYGHSDRALEELRRQQGIPWFGAFTIDVKLGLRMLRKYLGLTLIGGLAMIVGFGIIMTVFAYFDIVAWADSVPLEEGDRVVAIQVWDPQRSRRSEITSADFERWRSELRSLDDIAAFRTVERGLVHPNGEVEAVPVAEISAIGFQVARVRPLLGRTLSTEDESDGAEPVVVMGYDEWQARFDGDPAAVGRTLRLNDGFHTIVGIMPDGFGFPVNHQFWVPLQLKLGDHISAPPQGAVFARLAEDATLERVQAELSAVGLIRVGESEQAGEPLRLNVLPYTNNFIDDIDPQDLSSRVWTGRLIVFLVALLLVPPLVNIGMLVYARTVTRKEEIAVRTALGASRSRIVVQLFIEMLVLSTIAMAAALVIIGFVLGRIEGLALRALGRLPFWLNLTLSLDMLAFAASVAVFAALIAGLLPALAATRTHARPGLSALDPRNRTRLGWFWSTLIVVQIAFSFAALPSAVELGWGVLRASVLGSGFAAEQYLTAGLTFDFTDASGILEPESLSAYNAAKDEFIRGVEADPRVSSAVGAASEAPGQGARWRRVRVEDGTGSAAVPSSPARSVDIDDRYLDALGIELLVGQDFGAGDYLSDSRSVLVNASFAEDHFPGTNPLGRRISYWLPPSLQRPGGQQQATWFEIIGVISDRPAHPYRGSVFHPVDRSRLTPSTIVFRADPADGSLRGDLNDLAARIDSRLALQNVQTLEELYDEQAVGNYVGGLTLILGGTAVLALAAAGTYALMSFTVNQRRREIAIRMALGARPRKLLRAIFRDALRQVAVGAGLGLILAILVQAKLPADFLGGLNVPGVVPSAVTLLVLIGLAASFAPARSALRTDPRECLSDQG